MLGYSELRPNQERVVAQFLSGKLEAADRDIFNYAALFQMGVYFLLL